MRNRVRNRVRDIWWVSAASVVSFNIWVSLLERDQLPAQDDSLPPGETTGVVLASRDIEGHLVIWFLAGVVGLGLGRTRRVRFLLAGVLVAVSGLVELAQETFIETRVGQWADLGANAVGIVAAALLIEVVAWLRLRSSGLT